MIFPTFVPNVPSARYNLPNAISFFHYLHWLSLLVPSLYVHLYDFKLKKTEELNMNIAFLSQEKYLIELDRN